MQRCVIVGAVTAALLATPANASSDWTQSGADNNGLCTAKRVTDAGVIVVGADARMAGVLFVVEQGTVPAGTFQGVLQVDSNPPIDAYFLSGPGGVSSFPAPGQLWSELGAGRTITVRVQQFSRTIDMSGFRDAMGQVVLCARSAATNASAPSAPPSPPPRPASPPPPVPGSRLSLVCTGVANYQTNSTTNASARDSYGASATGMATTTTPTRSREQYRVVIDGAGGKVKVPRAMQPNLGGRGLGDGWWALKDLSMTADRIAGAWSHNLLNSPRLSIDRRTGEIEISGLGTSFSGTCEAVADESEARRF